MKNTKIAYGAMALLTCFLAGTTLVSAATDTWDPLLTGTGSNASGTWGGASATTVSGPTANFSINGTADGVPTIGDTIAFGTAGGTGNFTVTLDNGGSNIVLTNSTTSSPLQINQDYTFAAAAAGDGLSFGNMQVGSNTTGAAGVTANFQIELDNLGNIGNKTWSIGAGSTLNLTGGGILQNMEGNAVGTQTVNITTGTYSASVSAGGNISVGSSNGASAFTLNQTGGTITGSFNLEAFSAASSSNSSATYNLSGGSMITNGNATSIGGQNNGGTTIANNTFNLETGGTFTSTTGEFRLGNDNGQGTANFMGGTFTSGSDIDLARSGGINLLTTSDNLNISAGIITATQIEFSRTGQTFAAGSTATVNLTGGTLYLGASGFNYDGSTSSTSEANANLTDIVNLGGGTIGVNTASGTANSTTLASNVNMNLTGTNGNVTFQAANSTGVADGISLAGVLSGSGGFTKTGAGQLTLSNSANTFSGLALLSAGTTLASSLGTANVEIQSGAKLQLNLFTAVASTAALTLDDSTSLLALNFNGNDTVTSLTVGSFSFADGTYTVAELNADSGTTDFSDVGSMTGGITVEAAVPEPSTWAMLFLGLGILGMVARRRRLAYCRSI